jgi:pSer/pThr/pTyr-binding forkhead associated (FHA) protein
MRTLKVMSGPAAGQSLEIDRELVIGRENADLTIADSEVSRRHAAVRPVEQGVEIEDLGSLNGTFVNGDRIDSPVTLSLSGTLRVSGSEIRVELELLAPTAVRPTVPDAGPTKARDIPPAEQRTRIGGQPAPPPAEAEAADAPPAAAPPGGPRVAPPPARYGGPTATGRRAPRIPKQVLFAIALLFLAAVIALILVLALG